MSRAETGEMRTYRVELGFRDPGPSASGAIRIAARSRAEAKRMAEEAVPALVAACFGIPAHPLAAVRAVDQGPAHDLATAPRIVGVDLYLSRF